ncbi:phosphate ABC transporter substrate-binding protein [Nodularia harveyana UHCC-0300]|uniref:Phosphate ABC transporter substrate-binding protein n=1 Tax=Nodularia harveyana UHCC-0300 TaxID=2974287 RepID=A0ABU5UB81_9CYAN|nr:phosphate ABC transporter substrate-binding protein [Nodularia harveyana]MEA5580633.1 phosphate ABC transporter substrate-binding protein [Nodularia harveyana UHCC-0300]
MATNSKNREILILVLTLLLTVGILGLGVRYFPRLSGLMQSSESPNQDSSQSLNNNDPSSGSKSQPVASFDLNTLDTSLPNPTILSIDGSVSIVTIVKQFQVAYNFINPNLPTTYGIPDGKPNGTNAGLKNLIDGKVLMAAISRPLNGSELEAGIVGVPIARDALAIAVGVNNPYQGGLTLEQLRLIFLGEITNWSDVGGPNLPIKVINRSRDSGTHSFFQESVLSGKSFAPDGANFTTVDQDETTPILRALGNDGISYSTVTQVENQQTVRILPINGMSPTDKALVKNGTYPISRVVYLAVPRKTSPAVKQFLELALSPSGQEGVQRAGFVPVK